MRGNEDDTDDPRGHSFAQLYSVNASATRRRRAGWKLPHVGQNENRREERGKPVLLEGPSEDVVGGTTVELVRALLLVDLRASVDSIKAEAPRNRSDPHPEDGTGATRGNGGRDTGDVADAPHTRGRGDHQSAERKETSPFTRGRLGHDANRFLKQTQRKSTRADEEYRRRRSGGDEHVRIREVEISRVPARSRPGAGVPLSLFLALMDVRGRGEAALVESQYSPSVNER